MLENQRELKESDSIKEKRTSLFVWIGIILIGIILFVFVFILSLCISVAANALIYKKPIGGITALGPILGIVLGYKSFRWVYAKLRKYKK